MGSMKIALLFFAYCFIFFSAVAAAPDPFYVWADSSCRTPQRQANFDKALAGALNIHKQGYNRIVGIPDPLTAGNFQKLFDGPPFDPTLRSLVECKFPSSSIAIAENKCQSCSGRTGT